MTEDDRLKLYFASIDVAEAFQRMQAKAVEKRMEDTAQLRKKWDDAVQTTIQKTELRKKFFMYTGNTLYGYGGDTLSHGVYCYIVAVTDDRFSSWGRIEHFNGTWLIYTYKGDNAICIGELSRTGESTMPLVSNFESFKSLISSLNTKLTESKFARFEDVVEKMIEVLLPKI